jgi:glycosyltransferase involved in cell wall biosynthesis
MDPLVSIIVPAYNLGEFTVEAVRSLLAQTYKNIEVIVVDDGSTDDTRMLLNRFNGQIRYIYKENGGACSARNMGFRASSGELIGFLDCDDLYCRDKLEKYVKYFCDNPDKGMVYSFEQRINSLGKCIGLYGMEPPRSIKLFDELLKYNFIGCTTPIMKREIMLDVGLWDENIFITADWDLWLRISKKYPVGFISESLSKYRIISSYIYKNMNQYKNEMVYIFKKYEQYMSKKTCKINKVNLHASVFRCYMEKREYTNAEKELINIMNLSLFSLKYIILFFLIKLLGGKLYFRLRDTRDRIKNRFDNRLQSFHKHLR